MTSMSDKANKLLSKISKEYLSFIRTAQYISNDEEIHLKEINYFNTNTSKKQKNDKNNKKREHIISSIINSETPKIFFIKSLRWFNLKKEIDLYISNLARDNNIYQIDNISCNIKAGRKYNYDFDIVINYIYHFNIELKFNAKKIKQAPQFVSPMKLSEYLSNNFEEFYYDLYLVKLEEKYGMNIPEKEEYLSKIHSPNPKCLEHIQDKYYKGCKQSSKFTNNKEDIEFYNYMKKISKDSISDFVSKNDINIDKLNEYLKNSQKNKKYMLYKEKSLYFEEHNESDYLIKSYEKEPSLSRYKAKTESGNTLKILIRWKNGNGVAFPAFQIS